MAIGDRDSMRLFRFLGTSAALAFLIDFHAWTRRGRPPILRPTLASSPLLDAARRITRVTEVGSANSTKPMPLTAPVVESRIRRTLLISPKDANVWRT